MSDEILMKNIMFDSNEFTEFCRSLTILKDICNDVDMVDGVVRQRSNDKSCIFEIDMTNLINEGRLPIIQLKQKLDLLKIFYNQNVTVSISDTSYTFSDEYSSITCLMPDMDYIDNSFMTEEELGSVFVLTDEDLILETTISSNVSERIKTISSSFNTSTLEIDFNGSTAEVVCSTQAGDQKASIIKDIITNRKIDDSTTNLVSIPFITDHDGDMTLRMYNIKDNVLVNKFSSSIGGVNFNIYSRSMLSTEED